MAELICSRYVPSETVMVKRDDKSVEDYLNLGYEVKVLPNGIRHITKPPVLEMVFREGERDFVFDMMDEAKSYYRRENEKICDTMVEAFVLLIARGKIQVTISQETYTLSSK